MNIFKKIVVRFPPSPTGPMHVGTMRTLLFNFLFAKQNNGQIVLRIEDTDKERSRQEFAEDLFENLKWLSISYDQPIYYQSQRTEIYKKYLEDIISKDLAYVSKEKVTEPGQRESVIRFRNLNKVITFTDVIRGKIIFDTTELGDFVIAKSIDEPLYHFAVVVDDFEMGITHVIRGDDHISNTPRQILLQQSIGAPLPIYAHLPLILAPDKSKLSKRKHGALVSATFYRNEGYLPQAVINFMALLGWNPGGEEEIYSMDELVKQFSLERIQKSGAVLNIDKLNWINREYIRKMSRDELHDMVMQFLPSEIKKHKNIHFIIDRLLIMLRYRLVKFSNLTEMMENGELWFYLEAPTLIKEKIVYKKSSVDETTTYLEDSINILTNIEPFSVENIKSTIEIYGDQVGRGAVLHPMRYALSGEDKSPDPFTIAYIIGREESITRLKKAVAVLKNN
jgi:nondiscriminating glutamyl-tRNA synthetase